jgi:hypothetical protein
MNSNNKAIVLVSQEGDPHITRVESEIKKLGSSSFRLDRYGVKNSISYELNEKNSNLFLSSGATTIEVGPETVRSIFWRPKPFLKSEIIGEDGTVEERFRSIEWKETLLGLILFCQDAKWVNPCTNSYAILSKPAQLNLAKQVGLIIPRTVVSNDAGFICDRLKNTKGLIYKSLSSFMTCEQGIYTSRTDLGEIKSSVDEIALAPGIYQEEIAKKFELRVTVVGNKVFTVKIDSQRLQETKLDWRHNQSKTIMSPYRISKKTEEALLRYHRNAGLVYCAYDFIVDKKGDEIFLEGNPSGQWLFLCDEIADGISQALALELAHDTNRI